nr:HigA family addiction module antitoxin [Lactobacillus kitasatonis]
MLLPTIKKFIWSEFMEPLNISVKKMAHDIDVPETEIQHVLDGKKEVSAELSIKLGKYFGVSDDIFFNIQNDIDMRKAKRMN